MRTRIAALTIIALVLLAVCCQILPSAHAHDAMETQAQPMAHLVLLAVSLPPALIAFVAPLFIGALWYAIYRRTSPPTTVSAYAHRAHPPDYFSTAPLQLALADGIINPKPY